jgi:uncharacterized protein YaiI (UPF0178 family)
VKILVDADSCPRPARELVLKTATRREIRAIFAANRKIPGIGSGLAEMLVCPTSEGAADNRIVELAEPGDLALTRDIPLAARLVEARIRVLDDRGRVYSLENIRERLSLRNFMVDLAESGLGMERSALYGRNELRNFANALDREITRLLR